MNTRNTSKRKSADCLLAKSKNTQPEVFVLPPNLLEKLGIKLDKIHSAENSSTEPISMIDRTVNNRTGKPENFDETDYVNTDESCNNELKPSILETASLMKESVFLSPTFVPTIANLIPGELEIASVNKECNLFPAKLEIASVNKQCDLVPGELEIASVNKECNLVPGELEIATFNKECKSYNGTPLQGQVNSEHFPTPLINSAQELLNNSESVDTISVTSQSDLLGHDNCSVEMKGNYCEYKNTLNLHNCIGEDNKHDRKEGQDTLNKVLQNISKKPNENQESKKKKINIINDEIIDITKVNKLLNVDNNNVLTPVPVGMLLPPIKAQANIISNRSNIPDSDCDNQSYKKEINFMTIEKYESNSELTVNNIIDIESQNTDVDILQDSSKFDFGNVDGNSMCNKEYNFNELCFNNVNLQNEKGMGIVTTELEADKGSTTKFIVNGQDQNSLQCPVFSNLPAISSNISNDVLPIDSREQSSIDSIDSQESHTKSKEKYFSLVDKKDVDGCNASCKRIARDNEQVKQDSNLDTHSTSLSNIVPYYNSNDMKYDSENSITVHLRKSKLCIQGVEKPGGKSKEKETIVKVYSNRQKVNEPRPNTKNITLTPKNINPEKNPQEYTQVMQSQKRQIKSKRQSMSNNSFKHDTETQTNLSNISISGAHDTQTNDILIDTICKSAEYCICSDFGQLRYYDDNSFYEHVHFWQRKNTTSELDLIFSIYVDNVIKKCDDSTFEIYNETPEESSHQICWNEMYEKEEQTLESSEIVSQNVVRENNVPVVSKINQNVETAIEVPNNTVVGKRFKDVTKVEDANKDSYINKDADENIVIDSNKASHVNKAGDIKKLGDVNRSKNFNEVKDANIETVKKRRRSLRFTKEEEKNGSEPSSKDVKCGVCSLILARREWKEHVNKDHGLIAWKAGDVFDSKNSETIIKIQQKIKEYEVLTCCFCNLNINNSEEYVSHTKKCIKNKDNSAMTLNPSGIEKPVKCDDSYKINSDIFSLGKNSVNCDTSKKGNIESRISLVKPNTEKSSMHESPKKLHNNTSISVLSGKEKAAKYNDPPKQINIDISKTLSFDEKSVKPCELQEKIVSIENVKSISTPSFKKTSFRYDDSLFKGDIDILNTSNLRAKAVKFTYSKKKGDDVGIISSTVTQEVTVKCGVCKQEMEDNLWINHLQKAHNYLAWKEDESSWDLKDENQVRHHLYLMSKKYGGLICSICGLNRKRVKAYLSHIKRCGADEIDNPTETHPVKNVNIKDEIFTTNLETLKCGETPQQVIVTTEGTLQNLVKENSVKCSYSSAKLDQDTKTTITSPLKKVYVKCGVCKLEMDDSHWNYHMQIAHNYIAWKEGESPLNIQNQEQIWQHLHSISKKCDGLVCSKCGLNRKYVKTYLSHIKQCDGMNKSADADYSRNMDIDGEISITPPNKGKTSKPGEFSQIVNTEHAFKLPSEEIAGKCDDSLSMTDRNDSNDSVMPLTEKVNVKCGVCKHEMDASQWNGHIQTKHNYLAWKEEESNIDLQDDNEIWQHLHSISKECDGLVCFKCGLNRKYPKAYLSHIKRCKGMDDSTKMDSSSDNMDIGTSELFTPPTAIDKKSKCGDHSQNVNTGTALTHPSEKSVVTCDNSPLTVYNDSKTIAIPLANKVIVNCGVCKQEMDDSLWNDHIQEKHNYLAWKEGESSIDLQDEEQIWQHLHTISKKHNGLVCYHCGLNRKYPKSYLSHVKECYGMDVSFEAECSRSKEINSTLPETESVVKCSNSSQEENTNTAVKTSHEEKVVKCEPDDFPIKADSDKGTPCADKKCVSCGVCQQKIPSSLWYNHIQKEHNYLAWIEGESSINLQDNEQIWQHLHLISKKYGGLVCFKCGLNRKYPKAYLSHTKQCVEADNTFEADSSTEADINNAKTLIKVEEKTSNYSDSKSKPLIKRTNVESNNHNETSLTKKTNVSCGVCKQEMDDSLWYEHMQQEHNFLAWKEGESSIDLHDKDEIWQLLHSISKKFDGLVCAKCGLNRKYPKAFLKHVKHCDGTTSNNDSLMSNSMDTSCISEVDTSETEKVNLFVEIKCGVCYETCLNKNWTKHIQTRHNYLAWKEGEPCFNLMDQEAVENHLQSIITKHGFLYCRNCGVNPKYGTREISKFLQHIEICGKDKKDTTSTKIKLVKCGVCKMAIEKSRWIEHIGFNHNYLAWKHEEEPLDLEDAENVKLHLINLSKKVDTFKCARCGFRKKYPKLYLDHIKTCNFDNSRLINAGSIECGVCSEQMKSSKWQKHAMDKHYNVAWRVGEQPIDLKSCYAVERYLKEYKQAVGVLVCKVCGINRVSVIGFYAHVLVCGKSEKEIEEFQNICEICNKVYICVYKNQHMAAHKEQEYAKERKLRLEKLKEEKENEMDTLDTTGDDCLLGRRKAAVEARNVIEKLKTIEDDQNITCVTCGFVGATAKKFARHNCADESGSFEQSGSDTDDTCESLSSNASDDSNLDAEILEEEEDEEKYEYISKKKRYKESIVAARAPSLPYKYNKQTSYLLQNQEDFFEIHFSDEVLFPEWLDCKYENLDPSRVTEYLPKVEKSCKINLENEWDTFNRFEVRKNTKGHSLFLGGTVKCLSWIPPRLDDNQRSSNYLSISCHQNTDTPRYSFDELSTHLGLIQIWDFGTFSDALPKQVLCIAHDHGTIWAMDWCPSGVREIDASDKTCPRLGLLAVACSNGFAYIFSVPYPSSIADSDNIFIKLKPVAELRLTMSSERRLYQATAISWSKQKGHAIIMVGYADGTTALYDLCSATPLLKCIDNGVSVFYPYQDRRDHSGCVTDVDIWPSLDSARGGQVGALCSTSMSGSVASLRPRCGQPSLYNRSPATVCKFTPGWPSVLIAPDDTIATQSPNELDWYGCGRRLGSVSALCSCHHCSRVLVYTKPLLRFINALPPYSDVKKHTVAIIKTTPLAKKRKISNDELGMLVEPLTYDEVITQYGVEVVMCDIQETNPTINSMREPFTERFPLADVSAMSFCGARAHHRIAAVGLHAGFVLIVTA